MAFFRSVKSYYYTLNIYFTETSGNKKYTVNMNMRKQISINIKCRTNKRFRGGNAGEQIFSRRASLYPEEIDQDRKAKIVSIRIGEMPRPTGSEETGSECGLCKKHFQIYWFHINCNVNKSYIIVFICILAIYVQQCLLKGLQNLLLYAYCGNLMRFVDKCVNF